MFLTAQEVCKKLQSTYNKEYGIVMQNGGDAGQTVPHVHLHLLPENMDKLHNEEMKIRTEEDMSKEA
jgi:diadenosine tetraphosphate (Ap4A) HIT family hydrolase